MGICYNRTSRDSLRMKMTIIEKTKLSSTKHHVLLSNLLTIKRFFPSKTSKFRGVKVAYKVVVKLEHFNMTVYTSMLINGMDVVLSVKSIRGEAPDIF